jgi:hypothetical protein
MSVLSKNLNPCAFGIQAPLRYECLERFGSQKLTPSLFSGLILNLKWSLIFILTNQLLALVPLDTKLLSHHE